MSDIELTIARQFAEAVQSVFSLITGYTITLVSTAPSEDCRCVADLSGVLDFGGSISGTAALCVSRTFARNISRRLTGLDDDEITDVIINDTIGELINQILGAVKIELNGRPGEVTLAIPETVTALHRRFEEKGITRCIVMNFKAVDDGIVLLLALKSPFAGAESTEALNQLVTPDKQEQIPEKLLVIDEDMEEILEAFIVESDEFLEQIIQDLVALESDTRNSDLVDRVFRSLHTLKGNSRGMEFTLMETMVHRTEDVIRKVRDGEMGVTPAMIDVLLKAVDLIKVLLDDIKERKLRSRTIEPMVAELRRCITAGNEAEQSDDLVIDDDLVEIVEAFVVESEEYLETLDRELIALEETPDDSDRIGKIFRLLHTMKGNARGLGFGQMEFMVHRTEDVIRKARDENLRISAEAVDVILEAVDCIKMLLQDIKNRKKSGQNTDTICGKLKSVLNGEPALPAAQKTGGTGKDTAPKTEPVQSAPKKQSAATIRVDVRKLNTLIDVTGELVLQKNRLLNFSQQVEQGLYRESIEEILNEINARMSFLVTDLQSGVMYTRMQPIGKVFSKYPRVVRDLARESGKQIKLVITGEETELDTMIIDEIGDPLIHLVRNACDHGIESRDVRKAQGKNTEGTVHLNAFYEGNLVVIEIVDDGKGMDVDRIAKKGIEKGLITKKQAARMAKGDILNLIFMPGFSTAEQVTAVSGRGVGMDVVRSSIAGLNGIIELDSELGKGSTVTIKLPLTLAVMLGLEVIVGKEKYLIPQETIVEIVKIPERVKEMVTRERNFLFRKKYRLPLLNLEEILATDGKNTDRTSSGYIVVIGEVEKRTGLLVDNVLQQQEVVVKPLGTYCSRFSLPQVNGATIMGDGSIELILNTSFLTAHSRKEPEMVHA